MRSLPLLAQIRSVESWTPIGVLIAALVLAGIAAVVVLFVARRR